MVQSLACLSILDGSNGNPTKTTFANGDGTLYILDGSECWDSVNADISSQIEQATAGLQIAKVLNLPTDAIEDAISEVAGSIDYSDGLTLYTAWQWDEADLSDGDQIGLCFHQDSGSSTENYAQCWSYTYENGNYDQGNSYQLRPSSVSGDSTLQNFTPLDVSLPIGTGGTWIQTIPQTAFGTTKIAFAAKFSPRSENKRDPIIKQGEATIVTYVSSRTSTINAQESTQSLFSAQEHRLGSFSQSVKWQEESVELSCYDDTSCQKVTTKSTSSPTGATGVTTVAAIIAACVSMLTF